MMQVMHDEPGNDPTEIAPDFLAALTKASKEGSIYPQDRQVLLAYALYPGASMNRLGDHLGWEASYVRSRLMSPRIAKYKAMLDGKIGEKMQAAAEAFGEWLHGTMVMANMPVEDIITNIESQVADPKKANVAIMQALKRIDPNVIAKLGGELLRYAGKQAELDASRNRVGAVLDALPSVEEARKILAADIITSPETPALEVIPIGKE